MSVLFYISSAIAVISTIMVVTRANPVHALLYLVLSFFSVALIFFALGAPFVAALEVIIYAGAIMVLFVFVIMMINPGRRGIEREKQWLNPRIWVGPSILAGILLAELIYVLALGGRQLSGIAEVTPKEVAIALFGPYILGVELASMLLLAGLIGAYHLGRRNRAAMPEEGKHL
ncbi:MAG: NADH-quinone oxidoreductase subunit J [Desulfomonilaceae bacterium]